MSTQKLNYAHFSGGIIKLPLEILAEISEQHAVSCRILSNALYTVFLNN